VTSKWLRNRKFSTYLMALMGICLTAAIVACPEQAFQASLDGLKVWWNIVLPALLPFFVAAEVLMGLGVVHFLGALLEPVMKPIFRVPGVGAFALAMGLASGYPIGAKITGELRRDNLCSQVEAERLISISNTADPLFMVGAVAVGMFGMPQLGIAIAGSHYLASLLLGLLMRYHGTEDTQPSVGIPSSTENILAKAFRELYQARSRDGRIFGQLFGDSIRDSVNTLLLIGGFITMFSVIIRILSVFGIITILNNILMIVLKPFNFPLELISAMTSGFFEITIGSELASKATGSLAQQVIATSAIIAWSGLSVHAQVAAMVSGTDIRITPYIIARIVHAFIAAVLTVFLLPAAVKVATIVPVSTFINAIQPQHLTPFTLVFRASVNTVVTLGSLLTLSIVTHTIRSVRIIAMRLR
jgi:sporulation integral membrane protein YlbJ